MNQAGIDRYIAPVVADLTISVLRQSVLCIDHLAVLAEEIGASRDLSTSHVIVQGIVGIGDDQVLSVDVIEVSFVVLL